MEPESVNWTPNASSYPTGFRDDMIFFKHILMALVFLWSMLKRHETWNKEKPNFQITAQLDFDSVDNVVITQLTFSSGGQFKTRLSIASYGKWAINWLRPTNKQKSFHGHLDIVQHPLLPRSSPQPSVSFRQQSLSFHLLHLVRTGADTEANRLVIDFTLKTGTGPLFGTVPIR